MSILDKIVEQKRAEIAHRKINISENTLIESVAFNSTVLSLAEKLINNKFGIIAEFKRKSPSKPTINLKGDVATITQGYQHAGASAVSILTDELFFGGIDEDVIKARPQLNIPILRKEFIIEPYQIIEAKSMGADIILLIAEILNKAQIKELATFAHDLGLETILEIHTKVQLTKYHESIHHIGVNNRNLKNFTTDIAQSIALKPFLPSDALPISESGLHTADHVVKLINNGYKGFLIGEHFMTADDPGKACGQFIQQINSQL